jgi:hypothetical protein
VLQEKQVGRECSWSFKVRWCLRYFTTAKSNKLQLWHVLK